jgi:hypothetical protein
MRPSPRDERSREPDLLLSSILDALVDCLAVVDARGTVRYLNAAWRRFDGDAEYFRIGGDFARACALNARMQTSSRS